MGIFSFLFGSQHTKSADGPDFEISASVGHSEIDRSDLFLLASGWKRDVDGEIHPPETVWANPRGSVYHHLDCCCGVVLSGSVPMTEGEAVDLGLSRCSRCDWTYKQYP